MQVYFKYFCLNHAEEKGFLDLLCYPTLTTECYRGGKIVARLELELRAIRLQRKHSENYATEPHSRTEL